MSMTISEQWVNKALNETATGNAFRRMFVSLSGLLPATARQLSSCQETFHAET